MEHYRINWIDGMRVEKKHLIDTENFLLSQQYASNMLQVMPNRYGMFLNPYDKQLRAETHPRIVFNIDKNTKGGYSIVFNELHFSAISPEGTLIGVSLDSFARESAKTSFIIDVPDEQMQHAGSIYLVLLFRPYETIPFGEISNDSNELPLRTPYSRIRCYIESVSGRQDTKTKYTNIAGPNHFPIAKLLVENRELSVDENYIPPTCNFFSHHALQSELNNAISRLSTIENSIIDTLKELSSNGRGYGAELLPFLTSLLQKLNISVTNTRTYLENFGSNASPFQFVIELLTLSRNFFNLLNSDLKNSDALRNQWGKSNIRTHDFELIVKNDLTRYEHFDMLPTLETCRKLLGNFFTDIARKEKYFGLADSPKEKPRAFSPEQGEDVPEF